MQKERYEILLESIDNKLDLFLEKIAVVKKQCEDNLIERRIERGKTFLSLNPEERLLYLNLLRENRLDSVRRRREWQKHLDKYKTKDSTQ